MNKSLRNNKTPTSSKNNNKKPLAKHDAFVKRVLENPLAASEFLEEFLPLDIQNKLDLKKIKVEKESYVEDSLKTKLSDIVYSVKTKSDSGTEEDAFIYAILEHQSSPDHWIAFRLWKYTLLLLERHMQKKEKLPIVVPLVLYNGRVKYTAPKTLWDLFDTPEFAKQAMTGEYNLIDLESLKDDDINYKKHLSLVLYVLKHIHDRNLLKMISTALHKAKPAILIDKKENFIHIRQVLWYIDSKIPDENKQDLEQIVADNLSKEDTGDLMRTIADAYIEEGMNKGMAAEKMQVAQRMLNASMDTTLISSITGLSVEEISKIVKRSQQ